MLDVCPNLHTLHMYTKDHKPNENLCVCVCVKDDSKPDTSNPGSNSSGMGSGAVSSSAGSPASKPNTVTNADSPPSMIASPASAHVAVCISLFRFVYTGWSEKR